MDFNHRQFEYAGFIRRALAFIVDTTLLKLVTITLAFGLFGAEYLQLSQQSPLKSLLDWRTLTFEHALPAIWIIACWWVWLATPGKLLFDCQVVDAQTKTRASPVQLIVRYLAYILSAIPFGLGFLWIVFDKNNQGWHDKLAKTLVIMQDESLHVMESYQ